LSARVKRIINNSKIVLMELLLKPWPWYIAGPVIGLTVPLLLLIGNKSLGISSSLRHICAACLPAGIPFFQYNWRKELWNLMFVAGITIGGFLAVILLDGGGAPDISPETVADLQAMGVSDFENFLPADIFTWANLATGRGLMFFIIGGLLVGFGTRYAGGCTSGHTIMGLSNLQVPSLIATIFFMLGGLVMTHFILPFLI
jgi:uncharacterized protein